MQQIQKQPESAFALTPIDRASGTWIKLMEHWTRRLDVLRSRLEGNLNESETALLRGRIAELRATIALNNEVPAAPG